MSSSHIHCHVDILLNLTMLLILVFTQCMTIQVGGRIRGLNEPVIVLCWSVVTYLTLLLVYLETRPTL